MTVSNLAGEGFWFNLRAIPETPFLDGIGPHPYSFTLGTLDPRFTFESLQKAGCVAFFAVLAPEFEPSPDWAEAGWNLVPLKQHFIHDPSLPPPVLSTRSRQNVQMANKHWQVEAVDLREHHAEVAALHAQMLETKQVVGLLNHSPACFEKWASSPHIETYAARDKEGFGIWAIAGRRRENGKNELHLIAMSAAPRAYKTGGFYAIYNFLVHEIGRDTAVYFGGAPRHAEGLVRFKSRFSNSPKMVWAAQAILQPEICLELQQKLGTYDWFPPYRDPFEGSSSR